MAKPTSSVQSEQTLKMIDLAVAQIEVAIDESNQSVRVLTDSLFTVTDKFDALEAKLLTMKDYGDSAATSFAAECNAIVSDVKTVVVASQFYDRLSQRLHHVSSSLQSLSANLGESEINNEALDSSLNETKLSYTMPEEVHIFDWIMAGKSLKEILQLSANHQTENSEGEIDLF